MCAMTLKNLKDSMALSLFGLTIEQAHDTMACICCKKPIEGMLEREIDVKEYNISGLCPKCFDKMCGVD